MTVPMLREPSAFELAQRMASAFSKSDMVPDTLKGNQANCLSAMMLAEELGESTIMVLNSIYFIHGRPSFLTKFMIARANRMGVFTGPLRWIDSGTDDNPAETCFGDLANVQGDARVQITIDLQTAIDSGWTKYKDRQDRVHTHARWATIAMQRQMLRWRSASWLINLYAPNCMLGIPTREELEDLSGSEMRDITPPRPTIDDFKPGVTMAIETPESTGSPSADYEEGVHATGGGEAGLESVDSGTDPESQPAPRKRGTQESGGGRLKGPRDRAVLPELRGEPVPSQDDLALHSERTQDKTQSDGGTPEMSARPDTTDDLLTVLKRAAAKCVTSDDRLKFERFYAREIQSLDDTEAEEWRLWSAQHWRARELE